MTIRAFVFAALSLAASPAAAHESLADWHFESGNRCTTCSLDPYFHWDFAPAYGVARKASVSSGTAGAFSECMIVRIGGVDVNAASYTLAPDGRGLSTSEYASGNTRVTREVYVPESGPYDFARYVDTFRNTGAAEANVSVEYYCLYNGCGRGGFFGGDVEECTVGSSDGDEESDPEDLWFVWNDADASEMPAVAVVTHGDGADEEPTAVTAGFGDFTIDFRLTIPVGGSQKLLLFLVQAEDTDTAMAEADALANLPAEATAGLSVPLPIFQNFITDGRPTVSPGGPYAIPEGGEGILEPRLYDRESDPLSWSWDLDGDGAFETPELTPVYSAVGLDGPAEATVAIHVEEDMDGGHVVERTAEIEVVNVAPIVTSEPPTGARRGGLYTYTPTVVDPGTAAGTEPMAYELGEDAPEGMAVDAAGTVTWTPRMDQLGSHDVQLVVEDDDGGEFTQSWSIEVTDNTPPYEPSPIYPSIDACVRVASPTFKVSNSSDLDGDALVYHFEADRDAGFRSVELLQSPAEGIPEGTNGFTEWRSPRPLFDGETYYWRAWVTDGIEASPKVINAFTICLDGTGEEGEGDGEVEGTDDVDASAGCACRATGTTSSGWTLAAIAIAVASLPRRKRS